MPTRPNTLATVLVLATAAVVGLAACSSEPEAATTELGAASQQPVPTDGLTIPAAPTPSDLASSTAVSSAQPSRSGPAGRSTQRAGLASGTAKGTKAGSNGTAAGSGGTAAGSGSSYTGSANNPVGSVPGSGHSTRGVTKALWNAIGTNPSNADIDAAAGHFGVIVLNPWNTAALHRIKQLDPSTIVLMYACLSSTRDSDTHTNHGGGIDPDLVRSNQQWFATDSGGGRINWNGYAGHWQMTVWDAGYQQAWVDSVLSEATNDSWDGVLADNDMYNLGVYNGAVVAGTSSQAASDSKIRGALGDLITKAGTALRSHGKILVPNISDARREPGRWTSHARFGGGMEENFISWGTGSNEQVWDYSPDAWQAQINELNGPGLVLAITHAASGDHTRSLYGYASSLLSGDGNVYWTPTVGSSYRSPETIAEQSIALGAPSGAATRQGSAWVRRFATAFVAVNPTLSTVTVTTPSGSVSLAPRSGLVQSVG